jgi:hypothetical protein
MTPALNVSTQRVKNMGCCNRFQSDIVRVKTILVFVELQGGRMKYGEYMFRDCFNCGLGLSYSKTNKFVIDQISFFNRGCRVSSPTDSKTHLVLVT